MAKQALIPDRNRPVDLKDYDPDFTDGYDKFGAKAELASWQTRLSDLQEKLYAQSAQSVLIVLQAMDSGGKDGTIKRVFDAVNPQGIRVTSFKAPSEEELAHDFLWRVHKAVPRKGMIGIFNRSHYEDVLVVRVNRLVPDDMWKRRYDDINAFEKLLVDNGTVVLKFFLHISKDEQKERFTERLTNPEKHWKFSRGDLVVREKWDEYMRAYEAVFDKTNTKHAPWHIIPANRKWYRNLIVTQTIVEAMDRMGLEYPPAEPDLDQVVIPD
jgi:PPK2 family polyphosphate:nucleotide phosphotransferase